VLKSLGLALVAAALAAPFAAAWGVGQAQVEDYLGPHRVVFATGYSGEVEVDLGPLGKAFLPSPAAPIGLTIRVGGVGGVAARDSLLSTETLIAYASLYADPEESIDGVLDRVRTDALVEAIKAETALLALLAGYVLRRRLLAPALLRHVAVRRMVVAYAVALAVVAGSVLAPERAAPGARFGVAVVSRTPFAGLTVDSRLLAELLDRGVKGVTLLSGRQRRAVESYIDQASASLTTQISSLPAPAAGESMLLGFSDLHCNQAITQLLSRLVRATDPLVVLSSGDDTVNGTAAERGCIRREAGIAGGRPFLVATGNHDSDVTESQLRGAGMSVLDGAAVEAAGLSVLGDDDPEQNIPFSVERTRNRAETEEEMGQRLVEEAGRDPADVALVHQPTASLPILQAENPPVRLVLWGHYHSTTGPTVVTHADGSWTVGMQQATAGGVRQPTFTSFSTPFSPPLISADAYFYFRDDATGLITGVQPVHFTPDAELVVDPRTMTGDLEALPPETREKLGGSAPSPAPVQPR
jgi:hypothetical protein